MSIPISSNTRALNEILQQVNDLPNLENGGNTPPAQMQPLTFTGAVNATYDGSEPVSVEIPQSGGEEWEFIGEFNVGDEDVEEWIISEDVNGNPIELKEIYFEWNFQPSAATTANTNLLFSNPNAKRPFATNVPFYQNTYLTTSVAKSSVGNGIHAKSFPCGNNNNTMTLAFIHSSSFNPKWCLGREDGNNNIKSCLGGLAMKTANATTGKIGAGSTIKIWGVRV